VVSCGAETTWRARTEGGRGSRRIAARRGPTRPSSAALGPQDFVRDSPKVPLPRQSSVWQAPDGPFVGPLASIGRRRRRRQPEGSFVRHHVARLVAIVAIGSSGLIACSSPAAADPYQLLEASLATGWDPVQVNVGFQLSAPGSSVTIDRSAIGAVLDTTNGAGAIHVSLPASDLGLSRAQLRTMGIDASSIQLDMVFDGDALYAKSPLLAAGMKELLGADTPEGDLTGWLRILSTAEVEGLQPFGGRFPVRRPVRCPRGLAP
jgi:hypothetical protein